MYNNTIWNTIYNIRYRRGGLPEGTRMSRPGGPERRARLNKKRGRLRKRALDQLVMGKRWLSLNWKTS